MRALLVALAAVIFAATAPEALVFAAASVVIDCCSYCSGSCRRRRSKEVLTVRFYPDDCLISESVCG
jgi:hypothetical protein